MAGHRPKRKREVSVPKSRGRNKRDQLDRYIDSLKPADLAKIEDQAMAGATGLLKERAEADAGPLAEECRRQIVKAFLKKRYRGKRKAG